jgi:hypothetical protein
MASHPGEKITEGLGDLRDCRFRQLGNVYLQCWLVWDFSRTSRRFQLLPILAG